MSNPSVRHLPLITETVLFLELISIPVPTRSVQSNTRKSLHQYLRSKKLFLAIPSKRRKREREREEEEETKEQTKLKRAFADID